MQGDEAFIPYLLYPSDREGTGPYASRDQISEGAKPPDAVANVQNNRNSNRKFVKLSICSEKRGVLGPLTSQASRLFKFLQN